MAVVRWISYSNVSSHPDKTVAQTCEHYRQRGLDVAPPYVAPVKVFNRPEDGGQHVATITED